MKTVNPNTGKIKIHTIACYDDVWKDLHDLKKENKLTIDKMLRTLINNYVNQKEVAYKTAKKSVNNYFDNKIKEIQKESKKM